MSRRVFGIVVVALIGLPLALFADASGSLVSLLVDLPGWTGESPEGADVSYSGTRSVMAVRHYQSGDKSFDASVLLGMQAAGAWNPGYQDGFKMEAPEGFMEVKKIDGFLVSLTYETSGDSGALVVLIQEAQEAGDLTGVFVVTFYGMKPDDVLKTAQMFKWKKLKDQVAKVR